MLKPSASKGRIYAVGVLVTAAIAAALLIVSHQARSHQSRVAKSASSASSLSKTIPPAARDRLQAAYAALPLAFEPNQGQTDAQVKYMARANGYKLYLTSSEAIFTLHKQGGDSDVRRMMMDRRAGPAGIKSMLRRRALQKSKGMVAAVHMQMLGADPAVQLSAMAPQAGKVNYFVGDDPSKWHSNVPLFGQVSYRSVYPGIDLAFHGNGKQLEFDYLVRPGSNANAIGLRFQGADRINTNAAGDLILTTAAGPIEMHRPVAYQEKDGVRQSVNVRFLVSANKVTFALGSYDRSRELVIDPTVTYSTYFGGDFADYGSAIAVDGSGDAFIAGATDSDTIPGDSNGTNNTSFDVYVTEINPAGTLQFTTIFGGSSDEFPGGIAIDASGDIYVSGTTDSNDFPVTSGAAQTVFLGGTTNGDNDAFAVKLAPHGAAITWGTYIAGGDSDSGLAIAIDTASPPNVYVVGETFSTDLGGAVGGVHPLPNGGSLNLGLGTGDDDGYIVKVNPTGSAYLLVSYLGGSSGDLATGVALDAAGNIYVSGETISTDLPVTAGVVQNQCGTDGTCNASGGNVFDDAFVVGLQANLSAYKYVTYYGGSNVDDAFAITADASGDAFVTGTTASSDFATAGTPFQSSLAGTQNAFALELNPTGTAASYSSYLGGSGTDLGYGITLDSLGDIYITGQTSSSSNFPLQNATQGTFGGSTDAFVTVLNPTQNVALFSTYLGGGGDEDQLGGAIALDSLQNIYVTGDTDSGNGSTAAFPTKSALDGTYGGGTCVGSTGANVPCPDAFIAAYSPATGPDFSLTATTPATVAPGSSGTSTVTLTSLFGYASTVNLDCSVTGTGSPLPACSASSFSSGSVTPTGAGATSTLTITTTGASAAIVHPSKFFYAMWLPIAGMSLIGVGFSSAGSRRKKLLGFLMVAMVMAALFLMPACGSSSNSGGGGGGGGGCTGCTPAGSYTVTITGTGTDASATTHSTTVTLTVN
ncbi:MAG: SBBP repeat-containing protein [Candidatus Sulfotelmatobacter sp.]